MNESNRKRGAVPLAAWLLGVPGVLCLAAGALLLTSDVGAAHPLLADGAAAIMLLVSGIALVGSAGFPLALRRLANRDDPQ